MQMNRTYLFIAISSIALLIVLIIQVNWILRAAKAREELFSEKASMILSKTAETLSLDKEACKNLKISAGKNEIRKIDSLLNHYMKLYGIRLSYYFEVEPGPLRAKKESKLLNNFSTGQPGCYKTCIDDGVQANGLELKLIFPGKEQFILAEMGTPFITSVILILVVLVMSWRTILSLMKEKRISEHTTDFLNNMTHEFKTPLTNIALAGRMITKDSNIRQEDKIKHYSEIILAENEKLRLQVEQVLSMTALERGEIPLQKAKLDFHQLIRDSLKCIAIQIENRQGNIKLHLDAGEFMVNGDKTHLTNALCNLIDNAIKYSGQAPELVIQTANKDRNLVVVVSDKGIGIEKKYQKKVFDKFFRVPTGNVHDVKGFGLGLAYTKRIVELHGGTIELLSETGKGTSFTISLPNV
jgi:two-component system, OmpR family, phosphate regulon sensor histidine kinase PhoR